MRNPVRFAVAAALLASLTSAAFAQEATSAAYRGAQPQVDQSYSYESYGLGARCDSHPFASGCDKRGFW